MSKRFHCSVAKIPTGCVGAREVQTVQPFPDSGPLKENLNRPLSILTARVGQCQDRADSYVVSSVKLNRSTTCFEQQGSGPNFQGGVLTLCTCKHQMRSRYSVDQWPSVWIAGFTSRTLYEGKHWLFYLAKVESAHESHSDLWSSMNAHSRAAKAAHLHYLGDVFKPQNPRPRGAARYSSNSYVVPLYHAHRRYPGDTGWKNDINYRHAAKSKRPPLLVADPRRTFMWTEPMISFAQNHCRDYRKWPKLRDLIGRLHEAP